MENYQGALDFFGENLKSTTEFFYLEKTVSHTLVILLFYWILFYFLELPEKSLFFRIFLGSFRQPQISVVLQCVTIIKLKASLKFTS